MADQKEINASFSCMGYGYIAKLLINGVDVGLKGGMSESKRLFNATDPMASQATPEIREHLFVLKEGVNTLRLEFKKTGGDTDRLTFEFYVGAEMEPKLKFETSETGGVWEEKITF